jgi:hypothetical protein
MHLWRLRGRRIGPACVFGVAALQVAIFALAFVLYVQQEPTAWAVERVRMQRELERTPGRHLVFARYEAGHSPHEEWVANAADIDGAKVVWARSMQPEDDRELVAYFAGRRVWDLHPDRGPPALVERGAAP